MPKALSVFCSGFMTEILNEFLILVMHATCSTHVIPDLITLGSFTFASGWMLEGAKDNK
jgi:hypothetical protein